MLQEQIKDKSASYRGINISLEQTLEKAEEAFKTYKNFSGQRKAEFLERIAEEIGALNHTLIKTVMRESGLTQGRVEGERKRTIDQLKMFADLIREGSWVEAKINHHVQQEIKPDIRKMLMPIGPVVVFTASNFPLAFSTAGADTASALAAGNPVIVKAHPSHPDTDDLVAEAITRAAKRSGVPDGVFSSLKGAGHQLGLQLVKHEKVKAVGFTGSFTGGMSLYKVAAERDHPIPVFAEMGSINPIILLPHSLDDGIEEKAQRIANSITLGMGQFCTKPGLIIGQKSQEFSRFQTLVSLQIQHTNPDRMLNETIWINYQKAVDNITGNKSVQPLTDGVNQTNHMAGTPVLAKVSAKDYLQNPAFSEEVFGPFAMIVECTSENEMMQVIETFNGQLTATLIGNDEQLERNREIFEIAQKFAGRIIFNGVPTGVEVCTAMHHGGPFPASTDSRFTSVGADAIKRFSRPIAFQSVPNGVLPDELKDENPLHILRTVNGKLSRDSLFKLIQN